MNIQVQQESWNLVIEIGGLVDPMTFHERQNDGRMKFIKWNSIAANYYGALALKRKDILCQSLKESIVISISFQLFSLENIQSRFSFLVNYVENMGTGV